MEISSLGFIGGGRITRIIINGLKRRGKVPGEIVVSDTNIETLQKLQNEFPEITIAPNDNSLPAEKEMVFFAVHPQVTADVLTEIKTFIKPTTFFISLVPRVKIEKIVEGTKCFPKIVRMIPNACSIVNEGYNPVTFSDTVTEEEKKTLLDFLSVLGECPVVSEEKLEAYAVITGMGPTYFWFQFNELKEIAKSFGLNEQEAEKGIAKMVNGTIKTLLGSGLSPEEVMDLIPVRPLQDFETQIKEAYHSRLEPLHKKLKAI
ncbi:MAG: NAD(P)-binding domain-containing protein [candidate division WOR-3 bacterium]